AHRAVRIRVLALAADLGAGLHVACVLRDPAGLHGRPGPVVGGLVALPAGAHEDMGALAVRDRRAVDHHARAGQRTAGTGGLPAGVHPPVDATARPENTAGGMKKGTAYRGSDPRAAPREIRRGDPLYIANPGQRSCPG